MRILEHLKKFLRATDVLESINAGMDHQQRLLDDKLNRLIELQTLLLDNQKAELANQQQQVVLMRQLLEKSGTREQAHVQALMENQNAQTAFQRVQIEMIGEWVKEMTGREGRPRTTQDVPSSLADK